MHKESRLVDRWMRGGIEEMARRSCFVVAVVLSIGDLAKGETSSPGDCCLNLSDSRQYCT